MIRPNRQVLNLTSLKTIKSQGNIKKASRKSSVGGIQSNTYEKKVKLIQSHKYLPPHQSQKTAYVSPQRQNLPNSYLSPNKSMKNEIIKQFNQQFLLHRSNNLNSDIEEIEKYKKQLERSFVQLKKLQADSKESIRIINNLNIRIQELETENSELKRLGAYKDNLIDNLEEKIRVLMDEVALAQRGKSNHTLDIIVSTQKQIKNMKNELIDLSKMDSGITRIGVGIPRPPPKDTLSRDLTNSSLSLKQIKDKDQVRLLEDKLRASESSVDFYKQRQRQLEDHIRQLEQQLEKFQLHSKTNFQTNKDTIMMLFTQAASLEAMIKQ